jgi:hypothetical protein
MLTDLVVERLPERLHWQTVKLGQPEGGTQQYVPSFIVLNCVQRRKGNASGLRQPLQGQPPFRAQAAETVLRHFAKHPEIIVRSRSSRRGCQRAQVAPVSHNQLHSEQFERCISSQPNHQLPHTSVAGFSEQRTAGLSCSHAVRHRPDRTGRGASHRRGHAPHPAQLSIPGGVIQAGTKAAVVIKIYPSAQKFFPNFGIS